MHKSIHHTCSHSWMQKTFTCTLIINESLFQFLNILKHHMYKNEYTLKFQKIMNYVSLLDLL